VAEHGTRARYVGAKCRCAPCREANRVYRAEHDRAKLYGRYDDLVDAGPVRAHLWGLYLDGLGTRRIAELADVSRTTISSIRGTKRGKPVQRVRKETAAAIMAIAIAPLASHALVPAAPTIERLEALAARGWTNRDIVSALGLASDNVSSWRKLQHVTQQRELAIQSIYESQTTRANRRAIARARSNGWFPWIDDALDLEEAS
jgi:hypothetical protein